MRRLRPGPGTTPPWCRRSRLLGGCVAAALLAGLFGCAVRLPPTGAVPPGTYQETTRFTVGGYQREFRLHVPLGYDGSEPRPLLVAVHGAYSSARKFEAVTGFSRLADRKGFIVVYPTGSGLFGYRHFWNSGHCCGPALEGQADDVEFLGEVIEIVASRLKVDRHRIYMVGNSNGGMLTYRYAGERTEPLAAIAVVAGTIGGEAAAGQPRYVIPRPTRPLPVLIIHGREDDRVAYRGGRAVRGQGTRSDIGTPEAVAFWRESNGCGDPGEEEAATAGAGAHWTWRRCAQGGEVEHYALPGWKHRWPGRYFTEDLPRADPLHGFDAAEIIWEFLHRHALGPPR